MNDSEDDDRLAARARGGDARALGTLYGRHAAALLAYLRARGTGSDDAEDILHETFVRLLEGRGRYEARGRFRAWLFTVATRLAIDGARARARHAALAARQAGAAAPPGDDALDAGLRLGLAARVQAALADLPPDLRAAFHMRVRERLSYRDMAAVSGDPEGTLRSRVHHALRRLQAALAREREPDDETQRRRR